MKTAKPRARARSSERRGRGATSVATSTRTSGSVAPAALGADASAARVSQEDVNRLAAACSSLAHGFAVLSRGLDDAASADRALAIASVHAEVAAMVGSIATTVGLVTPRTKATCGERLRWEWLASSARLTDGASQKRLFDECWRLQQDAAALTVRMDGAAIPTVKRAVRQICAALGRMRIAASKLLPPVAIRAAFAYA